MLNDIYDRISSGRVSLTLWFLAYIANVSWFSIYVLLDESAFSNPPWLLETGKFFAMPLAIVFVFYTMWVITRRLGNAKPDERGGFLPWIGWTFLAALPSFLIYILLGAVWQISEHWWLETLVFSLSIGLVVPLLVHANGRAINAEGPTIGHTLKYVLKNYSRIFGAYMMASLPFAMASDGLQVFEVESKWTIISLAIMSGTILFFSEVLCIAITVAAYRKAEAA